MRVAMLAPIAWRVPPRHYGPWERVVSLLTEGLVARGVDVTLFATADSLTAGRLEAVCPRPYEEDPGLDPKVWEHLHVAHAFERAEDFDVLHNHYDFVPLTYSRLVSTPMVTTIHGFSSTRILPVYQRYNDRSAYVAISDADRHPSLRYIATVHHGIDLSELTFSDLGGEAGVQRAPLVVLSRIHPDKGIIDAIEVATQAGRPLVIAGIVQDAAYFEREVLPRVDGERVRYVGSVGPAERDALLGSAAALLQMVHFAEPFGLSMVEALACGTPVIARGLGAVPEVVASGETGYVVDSVEQAVEAVAKLPSIDRRACRQRAERLFSVDRMVEDYLEVYERVRSGPASS